MSGLKKYIAIILAALTAVFAVACAPDEQKPETPSQEQKYTEFDLVKSGGSEYKILLSEEATAAEIYAAAELERFFEEATGVRLETERSDAADENGKFLAVGKTVLFDKSEMTVSAEELGTDGYKLKVFGNSLIMNAAGESGKIYAVYEFLSRQFDFKVFAEDEIYIRKTSGTKLMDFDLTDVPDFMGRDCHNVSFMYNTKAAYATRKRMNGVNTLFYPNQGEGSAWSPSYWNHSTFLILPPTRYAAEHADWYNKAQVQLCFGKALEDSESGRLMFATFTDNLKSHIEKNPTAKYFMIGQEDAAALCDCPLCTASNFKYGGEKANASGTVLYFVNKVAREIDSWLKSEYPKRADEVKICMFAYQGTQAAPVTVNKSTGEYEFVPEIKPEPNVMVRIAPLGAAYSVNMLDGTLNNSIREAILGWQALDPSFSVWHYNTGFGAYLYPIYNFHTIAENYKIYKDLGVVDILDQGAGESSEPFHYLKNYVICELLWDTDRDVNVLTDEFFKAYYKQAAEFMREYYDLMNANFKYVESEKSYVAYCGSWESAANARNGMSYFSKSYLNRVLEIFDRAFEAIEKIEDEQARSIVYSRVLKESLSPRCILLDHYASYYDSATLKETINKFAADAEQCGCRYYNEGSAYANTIQYKIENWLSAANRA